MTDKSKILDLENKLKIALAGLDDMKEEMRDQRRERLKLVLKLKIAVEALEGVQNVCETQYPDDTHHYIEKLRIKDILKEIGEK